MAKAPGIDETVWRTSEQVRRAIENAGYDARISGFTEDDNPYADCEKFIWTERSQYWLDGWDLANSENGD